LIKTVHFGRFEYSAKPPGENFSLPGVFVRLLDATVLSAYPGKVNYIMDRILEYQIGIAKKYIEAIKETVRLFDGR